MDSASSQTANGPTRRQLLKNSLAAGAISFPMLVPASVFGQSAPSNLIQVGQIGCGRIGRYSEMTGMLNNSDVARYAAVCDLDTVRLADGKQNIEANYARTLGAGKYDAVKTYRDYRELLATRASMRCVSACRTTGTPRWRWKRPWRARTCTCKSPPH